MWICAGPRDPSTKPSRGWLRVGVSKPQFILVATVAARNKVTTKTRAYWRGCLVFPDYHPPPRAPRWPASFLVLAGPCQRGTAREGL